MSLDRRTFLAGSLAAPLAVGVVSAAADSRKAQTMQLTKNDLPTPALLVDLDAFEANIRTVADQCKKTGCGFRPHAKTHKCPEIARRLVVAGALGASCATVAEVEALAAGGIRGLLLTSPIMEKGKIARMVHLATQGTGVLMSVGHPAEAALVAEAAEAAGIRMDVLLEIDVGDHRTGANPGPAAIALGETMAKLKSLRVRGVQAYSGAASHTRGFAQRTKVSREAMTKAVETRAQIAKFCPDADIVSGGSTGTYNIDSELPGVTELQVGSFMFMDVTYRGIGGKGDDKVYTDFQPSLFVLTTVVNNNYPGQVSIDAGTKAFSTDVTARPEARNREGLVYNRFGDEFGKVTAEAGADLPKLGERLEFFIPHCDPTVNLYDRIYAVRGDKVEDVWAVGARKETWATKMKG